MNSHTKETLQVRPVFDFELLLSLLSEKRLGGKVVEELADVWPSSWKPARDDILPCGSIPKWRRKSTENGPSRPNTDIA